MVRFPDDGTRRSSAPGPRRRAQRPGRRDRRMDGATASTRVLRATGPGPRRRLRHDARGELAARLRQLGFTSAVAAPIVLAGRLWGAVIVSSVEPEPFPPGAEQRIADFAELAAQALANAQAREELAASRARIVQAGDAERRRLERNLHDGAQQRLVSLALMLRVAARRRTAGRGRPGERRRGARRCAQGAARAGARHPSGGAHRARARARRARRWPPRAAPGRARRRAARAAPEAGRGRRLLRRRRGADQRDQVRAGVRGRASARRANGARCVRSRDDGVGGAAAGRGSGCAGSPTASRRSEADARRESRRCRDHAPCRDPLRLSFCAP